MVRPGPVDMVGFRVVPRVGILERDYIFFMEYSFLSCGFHIISSSLGMFRKQGMVGYDAWEKI